MSFDDLFAEPKMSPKKETSKESCPFCGKEFANVKRHEKTCSKNPDREVKTKPKPKPKVPKIQTIDENKIRQEIRDEIRKEMLESLTPSEKEIIGLSKEEIEKIESVIKFLGGTEGYQFIYKSITGDKIRGSMPHIIRECIKWLRKHESYVIFHRK